VTSLRAGQWRFFSQQGRIFSSPQRRDRFWGSPSILSSMYQSYFLGCKEAGREANHSPPSSAEVKNAWSCTSTLPYVCVAWCLVEYLRDKSFHLAGRADAGKTNKSHVPEKRTLHTLHVMSCFGICSYDFQAQAGSDSILGSTVMKMTYRVQK
jgi:hypothetical protein